MVWMDTGTAASIRGSVETCLTFECDLLSLPSGYWSLSLLTAKGFWIHPLYEWAQLQGPAAWKPSV